MVTLLVSEWGGGGCFKCTLKGQLFDCHGDPACFRVVNSSDMATLRGSKNYVWDTAKPLGQGATSLVYIGREKVIIIIIIMGI